MTNIVISTQNLAVMPNKWSIATGSRLSASAPVTNLTGSDEPSDYVRFSDRDPANTFVRMTSAAGGGYTNADLIALVQAQLSPSGLVRLIAHSDVVTDAIPYFTTISPNGTVGSSGASAVGGGTANHLNVDDARGSLDTLWVALTSGGYLHLSFPTPTLTGGRSWKTGANYGRVVVYAKTTGLSWVSGYMYCDMYENGVLKYSGVGKNICSTTGEYAIFPFDPAIFADPTLAGIECYLRTGNGSMSINAVWIDLEQTPAVAFVADSGWMTVASMFQDHWHDFGAYSIADYIYKAGRNLDFSLYSSALSSNGNVRYYGLAICDDNLPTSPPGSPGGIPLSITYTDYGTTDNPLVYGGTLDIGKLFIGQGKEMSVGLPVGDFVSVVDKSTNIETLGGQDFGYYKPPRRKMTLNLNGIAEAEAFAAMEEIELKAGYRRPIYVIAFPDTANSPKKLAQQMLARIESSTPIKLMNEDDGSGNLSGKTYTLIEKL